MIAEGRVALNGVTIDTPATILTSLKGITVDGNEIAEAEAARLFLYHKPSGLLVTERDPGGRPTIYDKLPRTLPRVVPVGRLDLNTEGLLLLTTDGGLKRQLELPATGVERVYRARTYGNVTQQQLEDLIEGVEIEGVRYGSIDANMERRTGANAWIEMKITEGKNREVRRVLEYLGLQVSRLIRTRYGPFVLGDLRPGAVGEVREHDIESFRANPTRVDLPQPARSRERGVMPVQASPSPSGEGSGVGDASQRQRSRTGPTPTPPLKGRGSREAPSAKAAREPERPSARPARPARPAKSAKAPRQRADGSLAVRGSVSGSARKSRSRNFREDRGDSPARPSTPAPARPAKGPAGGRGKPSGGARPPRARK